MRRLVWWPLAKRVWLRFQPILWFISAYIIALFIVSSGDLTSYSANYLWKNFFIFGCLVVAVNLHPPLLQPAAWLHFTIPASIITTLSIHLLYLPLMLFCSRQEMFPKGFVPLSAVIALVPFFIGLTQNLIRGKQNQLLDNPPFNHPPLSLKEYTLASLKAKRILLSSPCQKVIAGYAQRIASAKPQQIILFSASDLSLLTTELTHDFPAIQWLSCQDLTLLKDITIDIVIDCSLSFATKDEGDSSTLSQMHQLQNFLNLEPAALLFLQQVRLEDDQVNSLIEDYIRRTDHKVGRVVSLRHYPIAESPLTHAWLISYFSHPQTVYLQHLDHVVIRSLNLICQLITSSQHIGEAWALTEVMAVDPPQSSPLKSHHSFNDKINTIRHLLESSHLHYHLSPTTIETNEPHLAAVSQPALGRKKLDVIFGKLEEKLKKKGSQEAA